MGALIIEIRIFDTYRERCRTVWQHTQPQSYAHKDPVVVVGRKENGQGNER